MTLYSFLNDNNNRYHLKIGGNEVQRNRWIPVFVLFVLLTSVLYGCGANKSTGSEEDKQASVAATAQNEQNSVADQSIVINHEWGTTTLEGIPQSVVTLDFSFIDTLVSLGVTPTGNAGVGETKVPEYLQDKVSNVTDVGERKAPNLEVIQSVKPDLIIASVDRHSMIQNELKDIAPTIALDDASYEKILDNVTLIGTALGKEKAAAQVITALQDKILQAKAQVTGNPTAVVAGYFDDEFSVWIKDSFIGSLLSSIGVTYAFEGEIEKSEGKGEVAKVTIERLHDMNPDYIFLYGDNPEKLKNNPLYLDLKAVKENHFITVDRNLWSRGRGPIAADKILDEAVSILTADSSTK